VADRTPFIRRARELGVPAVSMLKILSAGETEVYRRFRAMHCDQKRGGHECKGKVTIDARGIVLQCGLCGDARGEFCDG
jgi:hypothetical protein